MSVTKISLHFLNLMYLSIRHVKKRAKLLDTTIFYNMIVCFSIYLHIGHKYNMTAKFDL